MVKARIIPCLQLIGESLVKTKKFREPGYIGDPINTVRIFNELEVDELCFLDIRASYEKREPPYKILKQIADEAFMPMAFGGGIRNFESARQILSTGFEKVVINTALSDDPQLVTKIADHFGAQAVIGSMDVKKGLLSGYSVYVNDGTKKTSSDPVAWAKQIEEKGAGEILLTSMDREGTWSGYDIVLIEKIVNAVSIPVIANGGAGSIQHISEVIKKTNVSAVALGSMVVYQKQGMGVLVNMPDKAALNHEIGV